MGRTRPRQTWRSPRDFYYYNETLPLFLLSLFAKNEKPNLRDSLPAIKGD